MKKTVHLKRFQKEIFKRFKNEFLSILVQVSKFEIPSSKGKRFLACAISFAQMVLIIIEALVVVVIGNLKHSNLSPNVQMIHVPPNPCCYCHILCRRGRRAPISAAIDEYEHHSFDPHRRASS